MVFIIVVAVVAMFGPHLWAKHVLDKYNRQEYFSGTGIDLARMILTRLDLKEVAVEATEAGDHYDPVGKTIRLTSKTCGRKTLTAVVVAAHEVGHAIQDHTGYKPLKTRTRMIGSAQKLERIGAIIMMGVPVLANLPDSALEDYLAKTELIAFTPATITDEAGFIKEIQLTKKRGYAMEREESVLGVFCLGAPIFDGNNEILGALSLSGTAKRILEEDRIEILTGDLMRTADEISRIIGYQPAASVMLN